MQTVRKHKGVEIIKIEMMGTVRWKVEDRPFPTLADAKNFIERGEKARKWSKS